MTTAKLNSTNFITKMQKMINFGLRNWSDLFCLGSVILAGTLVFLPTLFPPSNMIRSSFLLPENLTALGDGDTGLFICLWFFTGSEVLRGVPVVSFVRWGVTIAKKIFT